MRVLRARAISFVATALLARMRTYQRAYGWRNALALAASPRRWLPAAVGSVRRATNLPAPVPGDASAPIWAALDFPVENAAFGGNVCFVEGWALCRIDPIDRVDVYLNEKLAGSARLGLETLQLATMSDLPSAPVSGFQMALDPGSLPNHSAHVSISVIVHDLAGHSLTLPPRNIWIDGGGKQADPVEPLAVPVVRSRKPIRSAGALRLACFAHDLGYGGAQLYLAELLRQMFRQREIDCTVIAPFAGPLGETFRRLGASVVLRPGTAFERYGDYKHRVQGLRDWLLEREIDVVIGNTLLAYPAITAAGDVDIPALWAIHESYSMPLWCALNGASTAAAVHTMAARIEYALKRASAVVFEAEATRRLFLRYGATDRMITMRYGIDTAAIDQFLRTFNRKDARQGLGFEPQQRVVTCVGTFEPRKQQTVLAQAFAAISPKYADARLVLIGESHMQHDYATALRAFIQRSHAGDRILSLPITPDLFPWYGISDLFALVSDVESMPRTFIESMCFGVPVLAANVFGVPELVEDGITGFATAPNSVRALVSKLDEVLAMKPAQLTAMGGRARTLVRAHYDSAGYARQYLGLIDGLLANISPREALSRSAG